MFGYGDFVCDLPGLRSFVTFSTITGGMAEALGASAGEQTKVQLQNIGMIGANRMPTGDVSV